MRKFVPPVLTLLAIVGAAIGGYSYAQWRSDKDAATARTKNYTDRGRICLEAASLIRSEASDEALQYLESHALHAIRGVPMGRSYSDLMADSQALLVTARKYDESFDDVDLELVNLTKGDIPTDHAQLSDVVRSVTSDDEI
jgi:hypothetical protein